MAKKNTPATSLVVGRHPVREALEKEAAHVEKVLLLQGGKGLGGIRAAAKAAGVPVQFVPLNRLKTLAPMVNHQGVVAVTAPVAYREVDDLLAKIAPDLDSVRRKKPILLVLDQVEDPYNYGAMLRSAVAAGAEGVIITKHKSAPLSAAAIKASSGTAFHIPVARATNLAEVLFQLKERGFWVAGAAGDGTASVWDVDWERPLVLVMGSEGRGLRPRTLQACDFTVRIPMSEEAESLNVSVAAGILLFAATRGRIKE